MWLLGPLKQFLGIDISYISLGVLLSKQSYITKLLQKVGMASCNPSPTPAYSKKQRLTGMASPLLLCYVDSSTSIELEIYMIASQLRGTASILAKIQYFGLQRNEQLFPAPLRRLSIEPYPWLQ